MKLQIKTFKNGSVSYEDGGSANAPSIGEKPTETLEFDVSDNKGKEVIENPHNYKVEKGKPAFTDRGGKKHPEEKPRLVSKSKS